MCSVSFSLSVFIPILVCLPLAVCFLCHLVWCIPSLSLFLYVSTFSCLFSVFSCALSLFCLFVPLSLSFYLCMSVFSTISCALPFSLLIPICLSTFSCLFFVFSCAHISSPSFTWCSGDISFSFVSDFLLAPAWFAELM